jgi:hypothetical protein
VVTGDRTRYRSAYYLPLSPADLSTAVELSPALELGPALDLSSALDLNSALDLRPAGLRAAV